MNINPKVGEDYRRLIRSKLSAFDRQKITKEHLSQTFKKYAKDITLFQIIQNQVYCFVDSTHQYGEARLSRRESLLEFLRMMAQKEPLPDVEFLVLTSDVCKIDFPVLSAITFPDCANLAAPLGAARKAEGSTLLCGWDDYVHKEFVSPGGAFPWSEKIEKCVFRGVLRIPGHLPVDEWRQTDRGRFWVEAQKRPDLFDVGFNAIRGGDGIDRSSLLRDQLSISSYLPFASQQKYKYIINVGAWSSWADRMRILPFFNSLVFMHEAPCTEFYSPLMKPFVHYIPVKSDFSDLIQQVEWAKANDSEVQQIIKQSNQFARDYISEAAMAVYLRILLEEYQSRMNYFVAKPGLEFLGNYPPKKRGPLWGYATLNSFLKEDESVKSIAVYPEQKIHRNAPHPVCPEDLNFFNPNLTKHQFPETLVIETEKFYSWGHSGSVITARGALIGPVSGAFGMRNSNDPIFRKSVFKRPTPLPGSGALLAVPGGGSNYFHFMAHFLPRIHLLQQAGVSLNQISYFLVNRSRAPFFDEGLLAAGIHPGQRKALNHEDHYLCEHLYFSSIPGQNMHLPEWVLKYLRGLFLREPGEASSIAPFRKLYISRRKAKKRHLLDEAELISVIAGFGFEVVELESFSIREQAKIFSEARLVLGCHGAGLTNVVFCEPRTTIIELLPDQNMSWLYWALSDRANLDYHYILAQYSGDHLRLGTERMQRLLQLVTDLV